MEKAIFKIYQLKIALGLNLAQTLSERDLDFDQKYMRFTFIYW